MRGEREGQGGARKMVKESSVSCATKLKQPLIQNVLKAQEGASLNDLGVRKLMKSTTPAHTKARA